MFPNPVTPELSWFHALNSSSDSEGELVLKTLDMVDETMKRPGCEQNAG